MNTTDRNDVGYKRLIDQKEHYHPLLVGSTWFGVCLVCAAAIPVSIDKDDTLVMHLARHQRPQPVTPMAPFGGKDDDGSHNFVQAGKKG